MKSIKDILLSIFSKEFILAIIIVFNTVGFIAHMPSIILVSMVTAYGLIFQAKHYTLERKCILFLCYLPLTILLAQPNEVFKSWLRLAAFIAIFIGVSPLLQSEKARANRVKLLNNVLIIVSVLCIGSFIGYFFGINFFIRYNLGHTMEEYAGVAGRFGGLFCHSMLLGFLSAVSCIYLYYKSLSKRGKPKYIYYGLCACCAGATMFASSRVAFGGMLVGLFVILLYSTKNRSKFIKRIIMSLFAIALTFPLWSGALTALEKKQQRNEELGGQFSSREFKWTCRIKEFTQSPIYGVGFCAVDYNGRDEFNHRTGQIEPGSAWLAILSMTGIIGFALFCIIYIYSYKAIRKDTSQYDVLLFALLVFISIHFLAEGTIFSAGNPVCIIEWLIIGCCFDRRYKKKDKNNSSINLLKNQRNTI